MSTRALDHRPEFIELVSNAAYLPAKLLAMGGDRLSNGWHIRADLLGNVTTDATFTRSQPRVLFDSEELGGTRPVRSFDLAPDGSRFVMRRRSPVEPQPVTEIHLVLNWLSELTERVPVN